ncbi:MAG: hypothetical protein N3G21_05335, partial [Candidatus Hydrogenedentes bacterium]|nr:hypothetical protein [Candidatus Hydrogenedentota bacterium]
MMSSMLLLLVSFMVIDPAYCFDLYKAPVEKVEELKPGDVKKVSACWWGFDTKDSTEALQRAIDFGAEEVVVPNMGSPWVVRPINLRSGLWLNIMPGVIIEAKKGEFKGKGDSLFSAVNIENLKISGYGAVLRMHKRDYQNKAIYEPAEWRMAISLRGCKN